jgi:hypothetical protein
MVGNQGLAENNHLPENLFCQVAPLANDSKICDSQKTNPSICYCDGAAGSPHFLMGLKMRLSAGSRAAVLQKRLHNAGCFVRREFSHAKSGACIRKCVFMLKNQRLLE